jgi:hypothetical protein
MVKNLRIEWHVKPLYLDVFCIIIIIALNPVSHFITFTPFIFGSDTIAYATMAKELFTRGLLYIPSWGHVDTSLILPPLYPFLIAWGRIFSPQTLNVAEYVSSLCALMCSVMIFLYLKKTTNRIISVVTLILIQINLYYFVTGTEPLSESTFWLTLSITLYLLLMINNDHKQERKLQAFLAGLACCLVFLSRHIGIIVIVFVTIIFLIQWLAVLGEQRKILNRNFLFILLGWMIIFVPYAMILYSQTGQGPLTQGFRKHKYVVTVKDPEILKEIEECRTLTPDLLEQIETVPHSDYGLIYAERRCMRKLLPDASEMYSHITVEKEEGAGYLKRVFSSFKNPKDYLDRLYNNIIHLIGPLGRVLIMLFFVLCFLPFFIKSNKTKLLNRLLLPFFIIFYLVMVSFLTGEIERYIYILFPFCLMYISVELFICFDAIMDALRLKRFSNLILPLSIFSIILLATPNFFTAFEVIPKVQGAEKEYDYFREYIKGAPVFSLAPYYSYIAGGSYRILPDDSLDKVACYGKRTGVRWLLIVYSPSLAGELDLYSNIQWYYNFWLQRDYPELVKFRVATPDRLMVLYEIL